MFVPEVERCAGEMRALEHKAVSPTDVGAGLGGNDERSEFEGEEIEVKMAEGADSRKTMDAGDALDQGLYVQLSDKDLSVDLSCTNSGITKYCNESIRFDVPGHGREVPEHRGAGELFPPLASFQFPAFLVPPPSTPSSSPRPGGGGGGGVEVVRNLDGRSQEDGGPIAKVVDVVVSFADALVSVAPILPFGETRHQGMVGEGEYS